MGLDVYFRGDIANVLRATAVASGGAMGMGAAIPPEILSGAETPEEAEKRILAYRLGVRNTLLSIGLAFGLEPKESDIRRADNPLAGLLWAENPRER